MRRFAKEVTLINEKEAVCRHSIVHGSDNTSRYGASGGLKGLLENLQKPVVNGTFTAILPVPNDGVFFVFIGGGISNYGTRTAFDTNMTLYWSGAAVRYWTGQDQQQLGTFHLGDIPGRTTQPFALKIPESSCCPGTRDATVNATFVWNS